MPQMNPSNWMLMLTIFLFFYILNMNNMYFTKYAPKFKMIKMAPSKIKFMW